MRFLIGLMDVLQVPGREALKEGLGTDWSAAMPTRERPAWASTPGDRSPLNRHTCCTPDRNVISGPSSCASGRFRPVDLLPPANWNALTFPVPAPSEITENSDLEVRENAYERSAETGQVTPADSPPDVPWSSHATWTRILDHRENDQDTRALMGRCRGHGRLAIV